MTQRARPGDLRRTLAIISAEGVTSALMIGLGETFFAAFALALGYSEVTAGLLASLPLLAGAGIQLLAPFAVRSLGSYRRWVVGCATVQALSFLPLIAGAQVGRLPLLLFAASTVVYWSAGLATGPAWNAWVEGLVPRRLRTAFFAQRSLLVQLSVLSGIALAGGVLHASSGSRRELTVFAAMFGLAALARLTSSRLLAAQPELEPVRICPQRRPLRAWLRDARTETGTRLLVYMLVLQLAVNLAGPYFTPYMLGDLGLSYGKYTVLTAAAYLSRVLALRFVALVSRNITAWPLLRAVSLGLVPLAAFWIVSSRFDYLIALQIIGGAIWGCYELATFLLLFETIPAAQRVGMLTWFNAGNAGAAVCGSAVGGTILTRLGGTRAAYHWLFAISSLSRLLARIVLPPQPVRDVEVRAVPTRTVAVRPGMGGIERPVLPALPSTVATPASKCQSTFAGEPGEP